MLIIIKHVICLSAVILTISVAKAQQSVTMMFPSEAVKRFRQISFPWKNDSLGRDGFKSVMIDYVIQATNDSLKGDSVYYYLGPPNFITELNTEYLMFYYTWNHPDWDSTKVSKINLPALSYFKPGTITCVVISVRKSNNLALVLGPAHEDPKRKRRKMVYKWH